MKLEFKIGMNVVHASHGVGFISGIEEREFTVGKLQRFYILNIQDNGSEKKVFVPFETANTRIRKIIKEAEANEVFEILKSKAAHPEHNTWNRRYREYMEKISSGDIKEIAFVLKELFSLYSEKDLSFGERKLLEHAKELVTKELSLALNISEEEVEEKLMKALGFEAEKTWVKK